MSDQRRKKNPELNTSRSGIGSAIIWSAVAFACLASPAKADEGGVSFWIPGFFGSLAATPQQPGWSLVNMYYHTTVSAGADVSRAREITIGKIPANLSANLSANLNATGDLGIVIPTYVFATPVLGGQLAVGAIASYGRASTSLAGTLTGALTRRGSAASRSARGPTASATRCGALAICSRWLRCVGTTAFTTYMTYMTGDIPIGAYDSTRLSNIGIGHGALDGGGGYTYFNPQTGHEFSAVLGFTYNFENRSTQYQNGVDMHLDWGASQFLTKQFQIGLVGYVYKELGCDSGSGDRVGCFQSQVVGVGPQLGFIFPVGEMQGYLNFKGYKEFAAENRPDGWNTWVTFVISPAAPTPSPPRRMVTK